MLLALRKRLSMGFCECGRIDRAYRVHAVGHNDAVAVICADTQFCIAVRLNRYIVVKRVLTAIQSGGIERVAFLAQPPTLLIFLKALPRPTPRCADGSSCINEDPSPANGTGVFCEGPGLEGAQFTLAARGTS